MNIWKLGQQQNLREIYFREPRRHRKPKAKTNEEKAAELIAWDRARQRQAPPEHWHGKPRRLTPAQYLELKAIEAKSQPKP